METALPPVTILAVWFLGITMLLVVCVCLLVCLFVVCVVICSCSAGFYLVVVVNCAVVDC